MQLRPLLLRVRLREDVREPEPEAGDGGLGVQRPVVPAIGVKLVEGIGSFTDRSGKLDRARSRLYRGQILQENVRLKALAEIYTMHSFAQLCNLIFLSKFANFCQISNLQNFAKL